MEAVTGQRRGLSISVFSTVGTRSTVPSNQEKCSATACCFFRACSSGHPRDRLTGYRCWRRSVQDEHIRGCGTVIQWDGALQAAHEGILMLRGNICYFISHSRHFMATARSTVCIRISQGIFVPDHSRNPKRLDPGIAEPVSLYECESDVQWHNMTRLRWRHDVSQP